MTGGETPEHGDEEARIRAALWENHRAPNGSRRNARGEELVAAAEAHGDAPLLLDALSHLITAYEYSAERGRMFVPFARMLRMWDEDPGAFNDQSAYELFWRFKWVTSSMLDYPEIPLASIEEWLVEMERRYRIAGYNARTVRVQDFYVARHLGDLPRAEAAYADWLTGERDRMSDCHACEACNQGCWEVRQGRDEIALERWAEVLAGRLTCAEEPHRVLAYSLLPLLRLGRVDQARTNHLRGYRMARGNESLLPSVGRHIEFCALTGNEARGLEILAEHVQHLGEGGNPDSVLSFAEAALVLLGRLLVLGLAEQHVVGPGGGDWTVASLHRHVRTLHDGLVERFDRRNGTDAVSRESAARIAAGQPLLERLPLGLSAVLPGAARPAPPAPLPTPVGGFDVQLAEARRLRDLGHPTSRQAWLAVEATLGDREPDPLLRAELAAQRGIRRGRQDSAAARDDFEAAAAAYLEAGLPGDAAVNQGRAAVALALAGRGDEARALADTAVDAAREAVRTAGDDRSAHSRHLASALLNRAKAHTVEAMEGRSETAAALAQGALDETVALAADEQLRASLDEAEARRMVCVLADAQHNRAALLGDRPEAAAVELRAAADGYLAAGQPWHAAEPLVPLARIQARLGDLSAAEAVAAEGLAHGGDFLDIEESGLLHLLLAELLGHRDAHEEAVRHALEATRRLDEAGLSAGPGAGARYRLAHSYQALGRHVEAVEVLQAALPELLGHGDQAAVTARQTLAESLTELGEHAAAAEQYAVAAPIVEGWGEPFPMAQVAARAAEALSAAGRAEEAEAAYVRAQALWQQAGISGMVVRTLRARAWLTFRHGRSADQGRALMLEAEQAAGEALAEPGLAPEAAGELRREQADTWRQLGALLRDVAEDDGWDGGELETDQQAALFVESWQSFRRAADGFAACGEGALGLRAQAMLDAAAIRIGQEEHESAAVEAKAVQALATEHPGLLDPVAQRAGAMLAWLEQREQPGSPGSGQGSTSPGPEGP
jgi:hypothetical protein